MSVSVNNNISALVALGRKMAVSANNIANVESEGFKKSRALLTEGKNNQGVDIEIKQVATPGHTVVEAGDNGMEERELSNVNLAEELPKTMVTQRHYEANLKMVQTLDDMLGAVIDIFS